jgi:hypothetical protein
MSIPAAKNPVHAANKRYVIEMAIAGAAYIIILWISIHILKTATLAPAARAIVALLPGIPVIAIVAAILRYMRNVDELQRQINVEAFAIAAGITAVLFLTYGFLEGVGFPRISAFWTFASIDIFWAVSLPFITRRYK